VLLEQTHVKLEHRRDASAYKIPLTSAYCRVALDCVMAFSQQNHHRLVMYVRISSSRSTFTLPDYGWPAGKAQPSLNWLALTSISKCVRSARTLFISGAHANSGPCINAVRALFKKPSSCDSKRLIPSHFTVTQVLRPANIGRQSRTPHIWSHFPDGVFWLDT